MFFLLTATTMMATSVAIMRRAMVATLAPPATATVWREYPVPRKPPLSESEVVKSARSCPAGALRTDVLRGWRRERDKEIERERERERRRK